MSNRRVFRRFSKTVSENFELTTGSLLSQRGEWYDYVNSLPAGSCLIVLPMNNSGLKNLMLTVAESFKARGRRVEIQQR